MFLKTLVWLHHPDHISLCQSSPSWPQEFSGSSSSGTWVDKPFFDGNFWAVNAHWHLAEMECCRQTSMGLFWAKSKSLKSAILRRKKNISSCVFSFLCAALLRQLPPQSTVRNPACTTRTDPAALLWQEQDQGSCSAPWKVSGWAAGWPSRTRALPSTAELAEHRELGLAGHGAGGQEEAGGTQWKGREQTQAGHRGRRRTQRHY